MTALETRRRPHRVRCVHSNRDAPWRGIRPAARVACLAVALSSALGPPPSAAQEWVGGPGNPAASAAPPPGAAEAPPAEPPRPAPRARGLLGIGLGGAITSFGPALGLTFSAGGALSDTLRLDLVLSAVGYRGSFSPPPSLADRAEESNLEVSRGAAQLALTRRIERFEVWAGAGFARASASAEVLGPPGCLLGFCGDELLAEGSAEGAGPIVSAGVRAAVSEKLLLGVELHKPFIRRVDLGPLSVNMGSAYLLASFTMRFLSPGP